MATGAAATVDELRASSLTVLTLALTAAACTGSSGDDQLDVVFDVCGPITVVTSASSPAQTAAIDEAIELWRAHGVPAITRGLAGDEPSIEIRFEDAARNFHGVYEDEVGVIFINSGLTGEDQAVTVAHEMGHAFGLWHIEPDDRISVMNPGNLHITPTPADELALVDVWGTCAARSPSAPPPGVLTRHAAL